MRVGTLVAAAIAFGLWGVGVGLVLLGVVTSAGGCPWSYKGGTGHCNLTAAGAGPIDFVVGIAIMVIAFGITVRLPRLRPVEHWGLPGPNYAQGLMVPLPGGLGVWVPSPTRSLTDRAPSGYAPPATSRPFVARPRMVLPPPEVGPRARQGFARYEARRGAVVPIAGGLGVWVPETHAEMMARATWSEYRPPAASPVSLSEPK